MTIFFLILFHLLTNSDVKWNECCWKVVINICKQAIKTLVSCFKNSLSKPILFFLFIATINNYTLWIVCGAFDSNLKIVVMSFWIKFWIKCHFNLHFNSLNEYHISFIIYVFFCIFDGDLVSIFNWWIETLTRSKTGTPWTFTRWPVVVLL